MRRPNWLLLLVVLSACVGCQSGPGAPKTISQSKPAEPAEKPCLAKLWRDGGPLSSKPAPPPAEAEVFVE